MCVVCLSVYLEDGEDVVVVDHPEELVVGEEPKINEKRRCMGDAYMQGLVKEGGRRRRWGYIHTTAGHARKTSTSRKPWCHAPLAGLLDPLVVLERLEVQPCANRPKKIHGRDVVVVL